MRFSIVASDQDRYYRTQAVACRHLARSAELIGSQLEDMAEHFEGLAREAERPANSGPAVHDLQFAPVEQTPEPFTRSIKETAQLLSLGRSSIYRLIGEGRLETVKIGNRTLIKTASIRALAELRD